jgi:hypothetical protein
MGWRFAGDLRGGFAGISGEKLDDVLRKLRLSGD